MTYAEFFNNRWCNNARMLSQYKVCLDMTARDVRQMGGKKLLLVGGGKSPLRYELRRMHIDCHITSIDPYVSDPRCAHVHIPQDFVWTDFQDRFHECWALYSLPLYSPNVYHAICFYAAAVRALRPGGVLRVGGLPDKVTGMPAPETARVCGTDTLMQVAMMRLFDGAVPTTKQNTHSVPKCADDAWSQIWVAPMAGTVKDALNRRATEMLGHYRGRLSLMQRTQ